MFYEKIFCFKRLSNFKTEAVLFYFETLDKNGIFLHIENTKKFRFYQNSRLFSVNFSENSEQS